MYFDFFIDDFATEFYLNCWYDFNPAGVDITFGSSGTPLHFSSTGTTVFNSTSLGNGISTGSGVYRACYIDTPNPTVDYGLLFDATKSNGVCIVQKTNPMASTIDRLDLVITTSYEVDVVANNTGLTYGSRIVTGLGAMFSLF